MHNLEDVRRHPVAYGVLLGKRHRLLRDYDGKLAAYITVEDRY